MYENLAGKIKGLATAVAIIGAIASVIYGIVLLANPIEGAESITIFLGLFFLFGMPFVSWISSWPLYGLGELLERTDDLQRIKLQRIKQERISKEDDNLPEL